MNARKKRKRTTTTTKKLICVSYTTVPIAVQFCVILNQYNVAVHEKAQYVLYFAEFND